MNLDRFKNSPFKDFCKFNVQLSRYSYYKIGGPGVVAVPRNLDEMKSIFSEIKKNKIPFYILGKGSNVLISDSGFDGIVIVTSEFYSLIEVKPPFIEVGASVTVRSLLREASKNGWENFECLAGVPGNVGGAIAMNAGTHLGEVSNLLDSVFVMQSCGEINKIKISSKSFSYRKNHFLKSGEIIVSGIFYLKEGHSKEVKIKIDETLKRRKQTQPIEYLSCGSVFKNPKSIKKKSWEIIDELGMRGERVGNAQFSEKHSNFIVNLGNATANDVYTLIEKAKKKAQEKFNISLEPEVQFLGKFTLSDNQ